MKKPLAFHCGIGGQTEPTMAESETKRTDLSPCSNCGNVSQVVYEEWPGKGVAVICQKCRHRHMTQRTRELARDNWNAEAWRLGMRT